MDKNDGLQFDEQTEEWLYRLNGVELWREPDKERAQQILDAQDQLKDHHG